MTGWADWIGMRWAGLWVLAFALLAPGLAHADWRRAETEHFIVYSNGSERGLRDYAAKLERFDDLMGIVTKRQPIDGLRKLPVYLVDNGRELRTVQPGLPDGVGGFYQATPMDIRAVLVRGENDDILLHEYAHHFMFQNAPGGYPGWLTEGFAEFFATATVDPRGNATLGNGSPGRLYTLRQESWIPIDQLLRLRPLELERRGRRAAFYAQSWLLTHYLLADPDRWTRLNGYLADVQGGVDPVEALSTHFGMTPEALGRALRSYMNGSMKYREMTIPARAPEMAVTVLPESADSLMLLGLDVLDGAPDDKGPDLLARIRTAAARYPDDAFALTVLARAEIEWGDKAVGAATLDRVLAIDPTNVEALLMLAQRRIAEGDEVDDPAGRLALYREGRAYLGRAHEADPTDYRVLTLLARSRRGAAGYPTANDQETWLLAVTHAPQVLGLRGEAADALLTAGRDVEAEALLMPVANNPHGGQNAEMARQRLEDIKARRQGGETGAAARPEEEAAPAG